MYSFSTTQLSKLNISVEGICCPAVFPAGVTIGFLVCAHRSERCNNSGRETKRTNRCMCLFLNSSLVVKREAFKCPLTSRVRSSLPIQYRRATCRREYPPYLKRDTLL